MYQISSNHKSIDQIVDSFGGEGCLKLDLGCGYSKRPGFIGLDNLIGAAAQIENRDNVPDILMDLNVHSLPFRDNSAEKIVSSHFLEHSHLDHVINESYRVLKPRGQFDFTVPYANSAEGMYPGHNIFLTEKWFKENLNFQKKFEIVAERYDASPDWRSLPLIVRLILPFGFARRFLYNACNQMTVRCRSRKV